MGAVQSCNCGAPVCVSVWVKCTPCPPKRPSLSHLPRLLQPARASSCCGSFRMPPPPLGRTGPSRSWRPGTADPGAPWACSHAANFSATSTPPPAALQLGVGRGSALPLLFAQAPPPARALPVSSPHTPGQARLLKLRLLGPPGYYGSGTRCSWCCTRRALSVRRRRPQHIHRNPHSPLAEPFPATG